MSFYAIFVWVVVGLPFLVLLFMTTGSIGLMTYTHFMGDEFNWLRLLAMCLFGPLLGMLVLGIVFRGTIPLETSKDVFFLWLFSFIFIVLLFVLPSFLLLFVSDVLI